MKQVTLAGCALLILSSGFAATSIPTPTVKNKPEALPAERHLSNIKQLTFGGENAEAYFSEDGRRLIFQSTRDGRECDQIYTMGVDGSNVRMVSTGTGRTTCSYFFPNLRPNHLFVNAPGRQRVSATSRFFAGLCLGNLSHLRYLHRTPERYGAETIDQLSGLRRRSNHFNLDGKKIVFTSMRDGDLDIYTMDANGKNVRRLTTELGYDGGPF